MFINFFYTIIINIALMVSFTYILNRIKPFTLNPRSNLITKIYYSIGFVILSILTMHFNFSSNGLSLDLRFIPVMVAGFFGGPITGTVTGLMVGIYCLYQEYSLATIVTGIDAVVVGLLVGFFKMYRYRKNRYLIIPALVGTLILAFLEVILASIDASTRFNLYHFLVAIVHPLAFVFMVSLFKDLIKINENSKRLEREAIIDGMTGLFNFRYFDNSLKETIQSAIRRSEKLTVAFIDIDHFKKVNDTYGHQAGDEILRQLGQVIRHSLRPFDIAARYGGEEFAVILPGTNSDDAIKICERIRKNVENKNFQIDDLRLKIAVSIGVTTFPDFAHNDDDLIRQSDLALYRAKKTGRNKVVGYFEIEDV